MTAIQLLHALTKRKIALRLLMLSAQQDSDFQALATLQAEYDRTAARFSRAVQLPES